jgi:hypothetical protein
VDDDTFTLVLCTVAVLVVGGHEVATGDAARSVIGAAASLALEWRYLRWWRRRRPGRP